jgi:hypothetical protein
MTRDKLTNIFRQNKGQVVFAIRRTLTNIFRQNKGQVVFAIRRTSQLCRPILFYLPRCFNKSAHTAERSPTPALTTAHQLKKEKEVISELLQAMNTKKTGAKKNPLGTW